MINKIYAKKIAWLGPEGTYCEKAKDIFKDKFCLSGAKSIYLPSIRNVIDYTDEYNDTVGVLPIENSIEGIVRETTDNLLRIRDDNLKITAETVIEINHCLISKGKDISKIKHVVSYTQALAQCQNSLRELLGDDFEFIEAASTAGAVKELLNLDETYAAIGSEAGARHYGLNILNRKINDETDNKTRFVMISRSKTTSTAYDKTSIAFVTKNQSGALVKVLNVFDSLNINLLYIDSRPSKKNLGEYVFFTDFEGHVEDNPTQKVLDLIKLNTNYIKILGSYRRFQTN